jgi:hypothetical protein
LFDKATTDAWESQILSDNVFDLQFALGYDANGDGNLYEDDSVDDEWLGNHADDEMGAGGLADARFSQLRMVEVGFTVGAKVPQLPAAPVQVMNGPPRSQAGYLLRATRGRAYMRNLNIFF